MKDKGIMQSTPVWGSKTYIMGIMNITPDSFSGDGVLSDTGGIDAAILQAKIMLEDGADILDIGAESSRPGSTPISSEEELKRLIPFLSELFAQNLPGTFSIDTYKSTVAEACLEMGADWINDIWGLRADKELAGVVSGKGATIILMHNRIQSDQVLDYGSLGKSYSGAKYEDLISDIKKDLDASINIALKSGISEEKIILDPGLGFGKTVDQNLTIINRLDEIKAMGFPVLVGPSRKSFIGKILNLPVNQREEGTYAASTLCIAKGADIIRVHDVIGNARVAAIADAVIRENA